LLDKQKRPTTLSTKSGYRTLNILSLNPDNFISTTRKDDITHELQKQHIHIAAIQETHIPHDLSYARNGYRVITTAERKTNSKNINTGMYQGGVAILVHEELQRHIKQIERIGRRILKITLTNKNATMPITILATYAPHTGYTVEEKNNTGNWCKKK